MCYLCVRCPGPLSSCSTVCPLGAFFCLCGVLGHSAPVHRCARSVRCCAFAVSWATWLLFTGLPAWFFVLRVRCPGPLESCSPVCPLGALLCVCGVLGHLGPVHRCARLVCCLCVQCPGPLGSCSPVCPLGALLCVCGVLGHLAPVHRCACVVCCDACAVSWATWLLFTGVPAPCVDLLARCPWPLGSCSPVCPLGVLFCLCGVLGHFAPVHRCALGALFCLCGVLGDLAPVHRCARSVCCFACAVSWTTWLLFTGVPARCVALRVRCVLGPLALVHRCARPMCCAVSWATWLLFTGVPARCVAVRVRCPGPLGSCSLVCPCGFLCCVCGVLGHLSPVRRCARSVCCFVCAVFWATWVLFTGVPARFVACVCGVLGDLAPVHQCARSVRCFACAVSWATWLLFTGVPAWFVVLRVRCPGPLGSCSPVCLLGVLFCLCGFHGHLAPVHRCARSVCCFACAVSWATWLLFTGVPACCVVLLVRCPGRLGSCSPVCPLGVLFCLCGVLGHLAPVHRCARLLRCFACAVSWATWLLFTGVRARCVVLRVPCPGPLGSCSPVCPLGALRCVCVVSWAPLLLFTGALARCAVRCPRPLRSCSPVCSLVVLCCGLRVRGVAAGRSLVHPDGGYL